jgi:hypothetical protein
MHQYRLVFELHPAYAFGIPSSDHQVAPVYDPPLLSYDANSGEQFITRPDGSPTMRRKDERLVAQFSVNSIQFSIEDVFCTITIDAPGQDSAVAHAYEAIVDLFLMYAMKLDQISFQVTPSLRHVVQIDLPRPSSLTTSAQTFHAYDNAETGSRILATSTLLDGVSIDRKLRRSMRYLGLGDALTSVLPPGASDDQLQIALPLRFLQYWKALTTIVGDPSSDKDHQSRASKLGLGRSFFRQRVKPMHTIRDRYDVAHAQSGREERVVSHEDVVECRSVATQAMQAYFEKLKAGS